MLKKHLLRLETPNSASLIRRIPLKSRLDCISTATNQPNSNNEFASHAIYENGEFQLIEHLLQQEQEKEAEPVLSEKINTGEKTESEIEVVLVKQPQQQPYHQVKNQTKIRTTTTDYMSHHHHQPGMGT